MSSAGSYGSGGGGMSGVITITGDFGPSVTGNVLLTGGSSGAIFTGSGGNTMTESFNFLALPDTNSAATEGYISFAGNIAFALYNGFASQNTFVGVHSGNASTLGSQNTALGYNSLLSITTGTNNTAIGLASQGNMLDGALNTSLGQLSLVSDTSGIQNTAIGYSSMSGYNNGTANGNNVALGANSLTGLATGTDNIAIGQAAGNALATTDSSNVLISNAGIGGDNNTIRIGTQGSGTAQQNTCFIAGIYGVTVGSPQTVTIDSAGQLGSTAGGGGGVTAITGDAGGSATGTVQITGGTSGAIFTESGGNTITESFNFLNMPFTNAGGTVGYISFAGSPIMGFYGGSGQQNVFLGDNAGNVSVTAVSTTAVGSDALRHITSGSTNSAFGAGALQACTTAANNTGIGGGSLASLTTGQGGNVAIGISSLFNLTTGRRNIAVGTIAGNAFTGTESDNICIGNTGTIADANTIRIGTEGTGAGQQNLCFIAGIANATVIGSPVLVDTGTGQLGLAVSSERYKENIQDIGADSHAIMSLRPAKFSFKHDVNKETQYGLIAEEVHKVMPYLVTYDKEGKPYTVRYHELPTLLLKEIQRLHERIKELEERFPARI